MDSTPLLSASGGLPGPNIMQDHPVFLRASHSPWRCIPQNALVIFRGLILAYLIATAVMVGHYEFAHAESEVTKWSLCFDFAMISFAMALLYHLVTFSWTFTHLYYPDPEDNEGGIEGWIISAMSLPSNMASLRKQFYFSMFYTATCVACFMNSAIFWFITRQHMAGGGGDPGAGDPAPAPAPVPEPAPPPVPAPPDVPEDDILFMSMMMPQIPQIPDAPFSDLFGEGWFMPFVVCNLYGITSIVMIVEMLFFNSIKRPFALGSHFLGVMLLAGVYLAWAAIGKSVTDFYPFYWLDQAEVGSSEAVIAYCIGFVLLAPTMYTFMLGFVGIREGLTRPRSIVQAVADSQESLE